MQNRKEHFVVCGLGSLGQHCVVALKEFGVSVIGIEQTPPNKWEINNLPKLLDELIIGDCCQDEILAQANVKECRTVLIVTSDEEVNAQTALAVRNLNPHTRIVARSAQENLNSLLRQQLGNFFADEPTQLTASAFALAGLGDETLGFFYLDGQRFQVIRHKVKSGDCWCNSSFLYELNSHKRRLLYHFSNVDIADSHNFHQWEADAIVRQGDILIYIETVEQFYLSKVPQKKASYKRLSQWREAIKYFLANLRMELRQIWLLTFLRQVRRIALVSGVIVIILLLIGTFLFRQYYPDTNLLYAFYATAILLLGGYADLFGEFEPIARIPWWLQSFSLGLTVIGTIFVGILYALITETLLSAEFEFIRTRPPIPKQDHFVIIGLDRVGQRVAVFLREFKQSLVGITFNSEIDRTILPNIPIIIGNLKEALSKANLATAKSVVITTNNEMLNLEIALMARAINPQIRLVIGSYGKKLSNYLSHLLTNSQILGAYAVAADAFAGAAFGENIISLFRHNNETILVTEYQIESNDTLNGLLLGEIAYGYEVVIILHQTPPQKSLFMPPDDILVKVGDRIVILATIEGLRRIEQGKIKLTTRCWQVRIERVLTPDAIFDGANLIANISGCGLMVARNLMNNLPQTLPKPLYKHQAQNLVRELTKALVKANLVSFRE